MHPHVSETERVGFLKARCSWNLVVKTPIFVSGHETRSTAIPKLGKTWISMSGHKTRSNWWIFPFPPFAEGVCSECQLDVIIIRLFLRACFLTARSPTAPYFGWCLGGVTFNLKMPGQFLRAVSKMCAVGQKNITDCTQILNFVCSQWERIFYIGIVLKTL